MCTSEEKHRRCLIQGRPARKSVWRAGNGTCLCCVFWNASSVQYSLALEVYECMDRDGVRGDPKTLSTIVGGCVKGRLFREAAEILDRVGPRHHSRKGDGAFLVISAVGRLAWRTGATQKAESRAQYQ